MMERYHFSIPGQPGGPGDNTLSALDGGDKWGSVDEVRKQGYTKLRATSICRQPWR